MPTDYTGPERRQRPYMTNDVAIRIQKWAIGALLTIVMGVIGWVYSYGQLVLKIEQYETDSSILETKIDALDSRITELMLTRMDERFRRTDWEREEAKIEKRFDIQQQEINRLHKEINRLIDKLDEVFLNEERLSP